jgi:phosphate-selective porin OprO/OprP
MPRLPAAAITALILAFAPGIRGESPPQPGATKAPVAETASANEGTDEPAAVPAEAPEAEKSTESFRRKWGVFRDSARGLMTWSLFGGRLTLRGYAMVQVDGTKSRHDDVLAATLGEEQESAVDIRRVSFNIKGTIDNHLRYVAGFDFGPDYGVSDLFVEGAKEGLNVFGYRIGDFRAGYLQEPFSLARISSSYHSGFLERSSPTWTFGPGNNLGYMVFNRSLKQRLTWQVGFFSFGNKNDANASTSSLSFTGRVTGRPVYRDGGRRMVHVGAAYSSRTPAGSTARYRSRPEARFVDFLVDTGTLDSSRIQLFGLEAAAVRGPLWIQAEAIAAGVTTAEFGEVGFWGSSVEVGYFLTGETRPYVVSEGCFGRVIPQGNYRKGLPLKRSNGGAFEVVGRFSKVDLEDRGVRGGRMRDYGLGFSWYVDASSRVMLNVIGADAGDRGETGIVLLRYQYQPRIP